MPTKRRHKRHVGDTQTALAVTCKRPDGTVVDLTSMTVRFEMYLASNGSTKVAETASNVTVTDATNGQVQYDFQAADVDTPGTYYAYFTVENAAGKKDTYPVDKGYLEVIIDPDAES